MCCLQMFSIRCNHVNMVKIMLLTPCGIHATKRLKLFSEQQALTPSLIVEIKIKCLMVYVHGNFNLYLICLIFMHRLIFWKLAAYKCGPSTGFNRGTLLSNMSLFAWQLRTKWSNLVVGNTNEQCTCLIKGNSCTTLIRNYKNYISVEQ